MTGPAARRGQAVRRGPAVGEEPGPANRAADAEAGP